MQDEIILIDKPAGWTSFDVVAKMRGIIRRSYTERGIKPTKRQLKVGHAGTLDPFATGLLIVLLGDATKKATEFLKLDKVYEADFVLGQVSTTGDPEGEIATYRLELAYSAPERLRAESQIEHASLEARAADVLDQSVPPKPTLSQIEEALKKFTGEITQRPPIFSAIKINGQRAYKLARDGKEVEMPERQVMIYSLELLDYEYPSLRIRTHVSSGTYIRSLAVDIGEALGTGAYCRELRRTKIADWDVADARWLTDFGVTD
ncbi:MAG: tRNA pseudouridine(55) synthase TruB [Candidatus Saccharimonas sp.]